MNELEDLYDIRENLNNKIENFFDGSQTYTGDQGYQDLLEYLDGIETEIENLEKFN